MEHGPAQPSTSGHVRDDEPQQRWDCESILSTRSKLDNHPGSIPEPSSRKYKPLSGKIRLAAKTGRPFTVLPMRQHMSVSAQVAQHVLVMLNEVTARYTKFIDQVCLKLFMQSVHKPVFWSKTQIFALKNMLFLQQEHACRGFLLWWSVFAALA